MSVQVSPSDRRSHQRRPAPVTVAITGAAGKVGRAMAFRIASGEMLGYATPIHLRLLTTARPRAASEGLALELEDCASPCLRSVDVFADTVTAFRDVNTVLMLASAGIAAGVDPGLSAAGRHTDRP